MKQPLKTHGEKNILFHPAERKEFNIKEAYIDFGNDWASLRTGRQIIIWGKADGVQIVDIICPQDNRTLASLSIQIRFVRSQALTGTAEDSQSQPNI